MAETITIDGNRIYDIPTFYREINRVFMAHEEWELGESLDALNDLFYGGFGRIKGKEEILLEWKNFEQNRQDLGLELTKAFYRNKLKSPSVFNIPFIKQKLDELEAGKGKTYFEIILEIIGEHPNIRLIPK